MANKGSRGNVIFRRSLLILFALAALAAFAAEPKLEKLGPITVPVPPAVRESLQPEGFRVLGADGAPLAEIWLRSSVPITDRKEVEGANYPQLSTSELVGAVNFPKGAKDFRGQSIKPGVYTLRCALLPADGNHMGVSPDRDYLLLVPAADDPGPSTALKFGELVKLSARASGTNHPAVFSLVTPDKRTLPAAYLDPNDYVIFADKLKTPTGDLPFAVILKGVTMSF